jgi:hypothetical protein
MPLNNDKLAELKRLVAAASTALKKDGIVPDGVMDGLRTLARDLDPDIRRFASEALDAANNAAMAQGIAALAAIAAKLEPLGQVLDDATAGAAQAKVNLFFPKLAKTAAEALDKVTKLKKEIEALRQEATGLAASVGNIQGLQDLPAALDKVAAALEKLQDEAKKSKS